MQKPELMHIAESLTGLLPRLMRGLSPPERSSPGGKDVIDELPLAQLRLRGAERRSPRDVGLEPRSWAYR